MAKREMLKAGLVLVAVGLVGACGHIGWRAKDVGSPVRTTGALPKVGQCFHTRVSLVGSRFEGEPESGSAVMYEDGHLQISYDVNAKAQAFRVGDKVTLCVKALPTNCPVGDNRGVVYEATNQRTGGSWLAADSQRDCGGG